MVAELNRQPPDRPELRPGVREIDSQQQIPSRRRSEYDVTNRIDVTDCGAVSTEVQRIFSERLPTHARQLIHKAFGDFHRLYSGDYPGYRACDTQYHNLQHTLDVTLAMARLLEGHELGVDAEARLGEARLITGVICALFHDAGYVRRRHDSRHLNGAEYTKIHVTRSARFLRDYLPQIGLGDCAPLAQKVVHFTGYEMSIKNIRLKDPLDRMLGNLLGTADLMAQMADRCYLEKCRDRLYPEFRSAGIAETSDEMGNPIVHYRSAEDLLLKTPDFYAKMRRRMVEELGNVARFSRVFFGDTDVYQDEIDKNLDYIRDVITRRDFSMLRRLPPQC